MELILIILYQNYLLQNTCKNVCDFSATKMKSCPWEFHRMWYFGQNIRDVILWTLTEYKKHCIVSLVKVAIVWKNDMAYCQNALSPASNNDTRAVMFINKPGYCHPPFKVKGAIIIPTLPSKRGVIELKSSPNVNIQILQPMAGSAGCTCSATSHLPLTSWPISTSASVHSCQQPFNSDPVMFHCCNFASLKTI